jgi:hypothetical protein
VKGLAKSFEINGMFGRFNLKHLRNEKDMIEQFRKGYEAKVVTAMNASKFDKAETLDAQEKVVAIRNKLQAGLTAMDELLSRDEGEFVSEYLIF